MGWWAGSDGRKVDRIFVGEIYMENIEIETEKKLVQEWYAGEWSAFDGNIYIFNRRVRQSGYVHENVLDSEVDEIDNGGRCIL